MDTNGVLVCKTLFKIITLKHPRNCICAGEAYKFAGGKFFHPFAVKCDSSFILVKNLKDLLFVGKGIGLNFSFCQGLAHLVFAAWIADHACKIEMRKPLT